MKTVATHFRRLGYKPTDLGGESARAGFTLIELIGVMAIMVIIAGVVTPNVLHSIDLAAAKAEASSLSNLATEISLYTRDSGAMPTAANWTTVIVPYTELSSAELAQNRRQRARVLLTDATTNRAMILSVMNANAAFTLPGAVTAANFALIWNTVDSTNPAANWQGANWSGWSAVANSEQFMVIQRINLSSQLQTYSIPLKNTSAVTTVSYQVLNINGTIAASANIAASGTAALSLRTGQKINLYTAANQVNLNYTYVVGTTGRSIDFISPNWVPQ